MGKPVSSLVEILSSPGLHAFLTDQGKMGVVWEIGLLDSESASFREQKEAFSLLLQSLSPDFLLRIQLQVRRRPELGDAPPFPRPALQERGWVEKKLNIVLEKSLKLRAGWKVPRPVQKEIDSFWKTLPRGELKTLKAQSWNPSQLQEAFEPQGVLGEAGVLDTGTELLSVLRLCEPQGSPPEEGSLGRLLDQLPPPFEVHVSLKKQSAQKTEFQLRRLLNQHRSLKDPVAEKREEELEELLQETSFHKRALFQMEWQVILSRFSKKELREATEQTLPLLRRLGSALVEVPGLYPSLQATFLGSSPYVSFPLLEPLAYLPFSTAGETQRLDLKPLPTGSVLLHRRDHSLRAFHLFDPQYLSYNTLITGRTGSGKSVMGNLLSESWLSSPEIVLRKIDVGGSYQNECERWKGTELTFDLNQASGLNPLGVLQEKEVTPEKKAILSELLCVLIREEGESVISKTLRAQVEEGLEQYLRVLKAHPHPASLSHLLETVPSFPRFSLLKRYGTGGLLENALKEKKEIELSQQRYLYYNFKDLASARQSDYAQAVMAAVIAEVNLTMLELSKSSQRLVLFCDETKFFLESQASFFLLTMANFRKWGHAVVLLGQNVKDFEIPGPQGEKDRGILLNAATRFYFGAQIEPDYLEKQLHLPPEKAQFISQGGSGGSDFRECVLQDELGCRFLRVFLSDEEALRFSSKKEDRDQLKQLRSSLPWMSLNQALRVLQMEKAQP